LLKLIITALVLIYSFEAYSQVEVASIYKEYFKINENPKKIKDSKIRRFTELTTVNGKQDTVRVNSYDINGNLSQEIIKSFAATPDDRDVRFNYNYVYDSFGKLIQKVDSSGAEVKKIMLYYDDIGNIEQEKEFNSRGKNNREVSFEYDELSRLIESTEINHINGCRTVQQFEYDSYNNLVTIKSDRSCKDMGNEISVVKYNYKYNNKYNIIEKLSILPNGSFKTETFQYDSMGNMIQSYESVNKSEYNEYLIAYDKNNNKYQIDKKVVAGDIVKHYTEQFKYDDKGNVIEDKYSDENGKVLSVHTYYYEFY
jgi:hypothetical protein